MGGDTRTKRSAASPFLTIPRKTYRFVFTASPGPHLKEESYPLAVLLRDVLKIANTAREARVAIKGGKILVDGIARSDLGFPVGLMDVISVPALEQPHYRLLPFNGKLLKPHSITGEESKLKPCRVKTKVTVRGGGIQLGLHDGRTLLQPANTSIRRGDTCLIELPEQKLTKTIPLKEKHLALVVKGDLAGRVGRIEAIEPGTFSRRPEAQIDINGEATHLPLESLFVIGAKEPIISLPTS